MAKKLPEHMQQTLRFYKRKKRKELRDIRKTVDEFNLGCAYIPKEAFLKFDKARKLIEEVYEICKPWWRKA